MHPERAWILAIVVGIGILIGTCALMTHRAQGPGASRSAPIQLANYEDLTEGSFSQHISSVDAGTSAQSDSEVGPTERDLIDSARKEDAGDTAIDSRAPIDWNSVRYGCPIPRAVPTRESDDPLEAGFPTQWVERALDNRTTASLRLYQGRQKYVPAVPLAMPIASERKQANDTWAYGVEYEIRRIVRERLGPDFPVAPRIFCNGHGCLSYFEGITSRSPLSTVTDSLLTEPWAKDFSIDGSNIYWTNGADPEKSKEYDWQMIIISRNPYAPSATREEEGRRTH